MKKFIKLLCLGLALVFISGCESKDSMEDTNHNPYRRHCT